MLKAYQNNPISSAFSCLLDIVHLILSTGYINKYTYKIKVKYNIAEISNVKNEHKNQMKINTMTNVVAISIDKVDEKD